jgi:hypothetical protein
MTSDDECVKRLWEELLALRKAVKDAEANVRNSPRRIWVHPTNLTAPLRPKGGPRKPGSK